MSSITFEQASCLYPGSDVPALDRLDLRVRDGEMLVLVGPPRSGKTSALRLIAGLEEVASGRILIGERDVTRVPPKDRDVAIVFQNYALYPHLSVADNMGFSLKISGVPATEVRSRVEEAAAILGLTEELDNRPSSLSSAQRQQVALGRAVVRKPQAFLMDEPLVSLDPDMREQTREQIVRLQKQLGVTTVYATADQLEAMLMADRVAVLINGKLEQVGTPREVYDSPANVAVAAFIGMPAMNLFRARVAEGKVAFAGLEFEVGAGETEVQVGVRPEDLRVGPSDGAGLRAIVAEVIETEGGVYARVRPEGLDEELLAVSVTPGLAAGNPVSVIPDRKHVHLFSERSGLRL